MSRKRQPKITGVEIRHLCGKCGKVQSVHRDTNGNADPKLTSRIFKCRFCGFTFDRDYPQGGRPGADTGTGWSEEVPLDC